MAPTDVFILNVGSGSCAIVSHPSGRKTMIDINNGGELRSYEYEGWPKVARAKSHSERRLS